MADNKSAAENNNKQNIITTNAAGTATQNLSPFVYWAQTDKQITLKVDLKDAKVG